MVRVMQYTAVPAAAEQMTDSVSDEEFMRKINAAPAIDADEETAGELRESLADRGATIGHEELKREISLT